MVRNHKLFLIHFGCLFLASTGLSERSPVPVPENLLKEAQQAAEEQKSMPGVQEEQMRKLHLPASLEKMFQQAKDEQEVEKLTKEGDRKVRPLVSVSYDIQT